MTNSPTTSTPIVPADKSADVAVVTPVVTPSVEQAAETAIVQPDTASK